MIDFTLQGLAIWFAHDFFFNICLAPLGEILKRNAGPAPTVHGCLPPQDCGSRIRDSHKIPVPLLPALRGCFWHPQCGCCRSAPSAEVAEQAPSTLVITTKKIPRANQFARPCIYNQGNKISRHHSASMVRRPCWNNHIIFPFLFSARSQRCCNVFASKSLFAWIPKLPVTLTLHYPPPLPYTPSSRHNF